MRKYENQLDEMQEQKLREIEHKGMWLAYFGLLLAIVVQMVIYPAGVWRYMAGEFIVFMLLYLYLLWQCIKNGIWDRRLKADKKTNFLLSLGAGLVTALLFGVLSFVRYGSAAVALLTFASLFVFTAALCFAALSISAAAYKRERRRLDGDDSGEE